MASIDQSGGRKRRASAQCIRAIAIAMFTLPQAACGDAYQALALVPEHRGDAKALVGYGKRVEVRFKTESGRDDVEVFPEPPLVIINDGHACEVDGGVWVRVSVHLSDNEDVLMVQEFSGSNDELVFYDTSTCKELRRIDVSALRWWLEGSQLLLGSSCSGKDFDTCSDRSRHDFDDRGIPE